jgi:hypothetical protein
MIKSILAHFKKQAGSTKKSTRVSVSQQEKTIRKHKSRNVRLSLSPISVVDEFKYVCEDDRTPSPGSGPVNFVQTMLSNKKIQNMLKKYDNHNNLDIYNAIQQYKETTRPEKRKELATFVLENYKFNNEEDEHQLWQAIDIGMFENGLISPLEVQVEQRLSDILNQCLSSEEFERSFIESKSDH